MSNFKLQEWEAVATIAIRRWANEESTELNEQIEQEIYQAVYAAQMSESLNEIVWQHLFIEGVRDQAGYYESRLMGIQWQRVVHPKYIRGDGYHPFRSMIKEPEGESTIQEMTIATAHRLEGSVQKSRPKKDGIFFSKSGDGVMQGSFQIHAPYKKAEFAGGVFFVFDEVAQLPASYSGFSFVKHAWSSKCTTSQEGIVVLIEGREYKWKFFPTLEVRIQHGMSEGQLVLGAPDIAIPITGEVSRTAQGLRYHRERYGRKEHKPEDLTLLSSLTFYSHLYTTSPIPQDIMADSATWVYEKEGNCYVLPLPYVNQEYDIKDRDPCPQIISAKASYVYSDGTLAVMKEDHKLWDLVGGSVEEGETPEQALDREIKEEMGLTVSAVKIGISRRYEAGALYTTHLYQLDENSVQDPRFYSHASVPCVPWVVKFAEIFRKSERGKLRAPKSIKPIIRDQGIIQHYIAMPAFKQFLDLIRLHPRLLTSDTVQVEKAFFSPFGDVYTHHQIGRSRKGLYFSLNREMVPLDFMCLYALKNCENAVNLPFGLSRKTYNSWVLNRSSVSKCFMCRNDTVVYPRLICEQCMAFI